MLSGQILPQSSGGKLLHAAVDKQQEAAWSEFFVFPKCILWSPVRGGRRLARKASMADVVKARLLKWEAGEKKWEAGSSGKM